MKDSLKIAYVFPRSDSIGGAVVHIRDMSLRLMSDGHRVAIWLGGDGPCVRQLRELGLDVRSLRFLRRDPSPINDLRAIREMRSELKAFGPDILSTHCAKAGFIGRIVGRSLGVPTFYTPHCWPFAKMAPRRSLYLLLERLVARLSHRIFLVAESERAEALSERLCDEGMLTTIHNGMPDIDRSLRSDPGTNPPNMIMVARFEAQKDHETLFRALHAIKDLDWRIDLVGDGPFLKHYKQLASELGMSERVNFCGECSNVAELMARSQLFLLISNWEGFPRSVLEAFRAGLPTVVTDTGGCSEAVRDGVEGCLVQPRSVQQLSQSLRSLLLEPMRRVEIGTRARQRYEDAFRFDVMYGKYLSYYLKYAKI